MTDRQALQFTKDVFDLIKSSKTIKELEEIPQRIPIPIINIMDIDAYPKIEFGIQPHEIQTLIDNKIIDENLNFATDISSKLTDPFSKLLYAIAWKNGDLKKVKHIINGILDSKNDCDDKVNALVFYQFGKYLTKAPGQPIIDQHVIRAFAVYNSKENENIAVLRKIVTLDKSHRPLISEYKEWLTSDEISKELQGKEDYTYYIDKLLFATGKTIKFRKQSDDNALC